MTRIKKFLSLGLALLTICTVLFGTCISASAAVPLISRVDGSTRSGVGTYSLNLRADLTWNYVMPSDTIYLKWDKPVDTTVKGYEIQMNNWDGWFTIFYIDDIDVTSQAVTRLEPGVSYEFRIRPVTVSNTYGTWDYETIPTAPQGIATVKTRKFSNCTYVTVLNEKGNPIKCDGYEVRWSTTPDFKTCTVTYAFEANFVLPKGYHTVGQRYYLQVRAFTYYNGNRLMGTWSPVKVFIG